MTSDPDAAREAFSVRLARLFARTRPRLYDVWLEAGCGDQVDELTNAVFLHLSVNDFAKLRQFPFEVGRAVEDEDRFDRWLLTVGRNLIARDLSRSIREIPFDPIDLPDRPDHRPTPDRAAESSEAFVSIATAMRTLSPAQRDRLQQRADGYRPRELVDGDDTLTERKRISGEVCHARRGLARALSILAPEFVDSLPPLLQRHFPRSAQRPFASESGSGWYSSGSCSGRREDPLSP